MAAGVDRLLALGELRRTRWRNRAATVPGISRESRTCSAKSNRLLAPGDTMLIKGSRFMQMERVVSALSQN